MPHPGPLELGIILFIVWPPLWPVALPDGQTASRYYVMEVEDAPDPTEELLAAWAKMNEPLGGPNQRRCSLYRTQPQRYTWPPNAQASHSVEPDPRPQSKHVLR